MTRTGTKALGLSGGVAAGKSMVARMFAELGASVIDADRMGHDMLRRDDIKAALRERWGDGVFREDGEVDRQKVAEIVFGNGDARRFLNGLVHPPIRQRIREVMDRMRAEGAPLVVLDAALLFEGGLEAWCDAVAFVNADEEARAARAKNERGWSADELGRRESAQIDPSEKMRRSDFVIDNSGERERTFEQVREIYNRLSQRVSDTEPE